MAADCVVTLALRLEDEALLERTLEEYGHAVEREEMTAREATDNYLSLFCGMASIEMVETGQVVGRVPIEWFQDGR